MINKSKIEKFFIKELSSNLKEVFIIKNNDGSYELFNKFLIQPLSNGLFRVTHYSFTKECIFSSLKSAFTYCIYYNCNKVTESKRIAQLDHTLDSLETVMAQQKKLLEKTHNFEIKSIYMAKLHESKIRKNTMLKELKSYINISRHWQYTKFLEKQSK